MNELFYYRGEIFFVPGFGRGKCTDVEGDVMTLDFGKVLLARPEKELKSMGMRFIGPYRKLSELGRGKTLFWAKRAFMIQFAKQLTRGEEFKMSDFKPSGIWMMKRLQNQALVKWFPSRRRWVVQ